MQCVCISLLSQVDESRVLLSESHRALLAYTPPSQSQCSIIVDSQAAISLKKVGSKNCYKIH
jgi:hypothetical protein